MAKIGVFGSTLQSQAMDIFRYLLRDGDEYAVAPLSDTDGCSDIIVCVEDAPGLGTFRGAGERTKFVVNPEHKKVLRELPKKGAELITCGFNGKDCVTASSVTENDLQICVQRNIPTLDGRILEPQEFCVALGPDAGEKRPELALLVVTALLAAGADGLLMTCEHKF
ncbi:MAG: hypothetical protein FWC55_04595 [Firmicutes bacterium]|nr:hypothetical protein [Bacillota bacterium]